MLRFSPLKSALIALVCFLGVVFSLPSLISKDYLPGWMADRHVNLGLDLKGGSYLLLQVDSDAVAKERVESLVDEARTALRTAKIQTSSVTPAGRSVTITVADGGDVDAARKALGPIATATTGGGVPEVDLRTDGQAIVLTLTDAGFKDRIDKAMAQSQEIVRRRIDETGVNEPVVARQGGDRILVQLPGVEDPGRIKRLIGQTAKMTFRLVVTDEAPRADGAAPPGTQVLTVADGRGERKILVRKKVEVDGANLTDASPTTDQNGRWVVAFRFDSIGARRFAETTTNNVGKPFAIVLDDKVISDPVIQEPITGGRGQISGSYTAQTANDLAVLLRAGALPVPLTVVEERTIGPELGADSIHAGLTAVAVGFVLVVAYMLISYGIFGVFANIALLCNLFLTLALLGILQATLTLPGIAGALLTLGMAVDANILINERIREELRKGATPLAALEAGFSKAYATITDSNLTTLIKMAILFSVGTGTIKGFAVTISLGILTSMFTATVVARAITASWFRRFRPKTLTVGTRLRPAPDHTNFHFMRGRHMGIGLSVFLSVASVVLFFKPGLNYGVDFAGGVVIEIRTDGPADFSKLRSKMETLHLGPVQLQQFGSPSDVLMRLEQQAGGDAAQQGAVKAVQEELNKDFPGAVIRRQEAVGASVSAELFHDGMLALGLAAIAMLAYITFRFEWQFGIGAVVTMLLDVTKTVGFFAITGMQFNLTSIAAILTIMGYSINDKVVVYDRVRENLRLYRKMPLRELIDRSINETLSRTIGTSLAIFLVTVPLALLAGEQLREFAWALLFGVVLATSSSIFIAAPILLFLGEKSLRRPTPADGSAAPPAPAE
ncbi:protein translocase subunit secF /protein translocase subunit secD [Nitrospirillum amazonense]|uniref:Multifunctional fusion protein n=1 Tax=Nitrospirillum amazonense TaxID=28077 RepID=A0A560FGX6_9PROT|nr:protein translocase subunit SecD [Nitrospirillum amazonense]TWB20848.1 protein translocase subunit secF /protein translocase subunit secD [Nitrospirillum amazonense]